MIANFKLGIGFLVLVATAQGSQEDNWKPVSDRWYTVTQVEGQVPVSYYQEIIRTNGKQYQIELKTWKLEEGYLNKENEGAVIEANDSLRPVFFNFRKSYRSQISTVDASFDTDKNIMRAKLTPSPKDKDEIRRSFPKGAILTVSFPIWLAQNAPSLRPGKVKPFQAIVEDQFESAFPVASGQILWEKDKSNQGLRRLTVKFSGMKSYWWLDQKGTIQKIELPGPNHLIQQVTKAEALKFFATKK